MTRNELRTIYDEPENVPRRANQETSKFTINYERPGT